MKLEFERPDYCEGCPEAEYIIEKSNEDTCFDPYDAVELTLTCRHEKACAWAADCAVEISKQGDEGK